MKTNRSMPDCTVIPVLGYADVDVAIQWLCQAFGAKCRLRIGDHRAQMILGQGAFVVAARVGPPPQGASDTHSIMARVDDVDSHCAQAAATGAHVLHPPTTFPYGERQYTATDIGGHVWTFTQTVADVDPVSWGGAMGG